MYFSVLYNPVSALSVQLLSEKISGAEGTKLDEDFMEMERVLDELSSLTILLSLSISQAWTTESITD